jgi:DNA-binding NarL/FixJ family response regulator
MTTAPGVFFLLDDDPTVTRALSRVLAQARECIGASDVSSATAKLTASRRRISGFVIDLKLPDGSGLDFLRIARKLAPHAPALILTGELEADAVNEAYRLGASCLLKPMGRGELARFVVEALAGEAGIDPVLRARVAHASANYRLTGPEADLLVAYLAGLSAEEVQAKRGITHNTYKTQVRTLLRKLDADSLEDARKRLLTSAS